MKGFATLLLVVAAVIFLIARANQDSATWIGYVRATAEAAMVGALADWFAVTALFKHPLGLPIPHTAIIPKRKDEIGEGLGDFVQSNFLTGEVVSEKLQGVEMSKRLGMWLREPSNAESTVSEVAVVVSAVSDVLSDDDDVRLMVDSLVRDRLGRVPVAPIFGRVIDAGMDGEHHHELYNTVLKASANFLEDNRTTFRRRLTNESPWWVPEPIDDRIFDKIYGAVMTFLREVDANPEHHIKRDIDVRSRDFAERLRSDERLIEQGEKLKQELLDHPEVVDPELPGARRRGGGRGRPLPGRARGRGRVRLAASAVSRRARPGDLRPRHRRPPGHDPRGRRRRLIGPGRG